MFMGVRLLWPPDCPDDILESIIKEVQGQETGGLSFDKDGQKVAENIKKFCDNTHEPYWHVFVGNSFGCHAIHEKRRFMYFYYKKNAFLIYKAQ
jgi:dynein light chain LC8-type